MARFYGTVRGQAVSEAARRGNASSGISGHIRGWDLGVRVEGQPAASGDEHDTFSIYATGGSHDGKNKLFLGTVYTDDEGQPRFRPNGMLV